MGMITKFIDAGYTKIIPAENRQIIEAKEVTRPPLGYCKTQNQGYGSGTLKYFKFGIGAGIVCTIASMIKRRMFNDYE